MSSEATLMDVSRKVSQYRHVSQPTIIFQNGEKIRLSDYLSVCISLRLRKFMFDSLHVVALRSALKATFHSRPFYVLHIATYARR